MFNLVLLKNIEDLYLARGGARKTIFLYILPNPFCFYNISRAEQVKKDAMTEKLMAQKGKNGMITDDVPGLLYRHRIYVSKHTATTNFLRPLSCITS
jgi:hypothetical protein